MRVLIVRLGAFGDILHTLPLAADLSQAGWTVDWVCEDRWAGLAAGAASTVHTLPRKTLRDPRRPWYERLQVLRQALRPLRSGYAAVIDAQGLAKSALIALAARGERVVGHGHGRSREGAWLAATDLVAPVHVHVIDQQRRLALPLTGREPDGAWRFPLPRWDAERQWAKTWLDSHGLARPWVLNVGAGWPTKVWPGERQVAFAQRVCASGRRLVLAWGSPGERAAAAAVAAAVPGTVLAPDTTIPQLAGLLGAAGVVVSGDTGPLHLARALDIPAVGLFGPVPAERNGPQGAHWRNLQAPGEAWERRDVSRVDMGAITPDQVLAAAEAVS
jgi:heptosyltransferase-1